jgi:hypothetical protein
VAVCSGAVAVALAVTDGDGASSVDVSVNVTVGGVVSEGVSEGAVVAVSVEVGISEGDAVSVGTVVSVNVGVLGGGASSVVSCAKDAIPTASAIPNMAKIAVFESGIVSVPLCETCYYFNNPGL